jgi:drug/metabolite transporter (DMT)-like permease
MLPAIPPFQLLTIALFFSFFTSLIKLTITRSWKKAQLSLRVWLPLFFLLCCNQISYVFAFRLAPPEQAEMINYLWPILVLMASGILFGEKLSIFHFIAILLAFTGIFILITEGKGLDSLKKEYFVGYTAALSAAFASTGYTLFMRYNNEISAEMGEICCGLSSAVCFIFHLQFETTVALTGYDWLAVSVLGFGCYGGYYILWNHGLKNGNLRILTTSYYFVPLIAIALFVIFGFTEPSIYLVISSLLVISGCLICTLTEFSAHKKKAKS